MRGSLLATALYTGHTWVRAGVPYASLLETIEGRWLHKVSNLIMEAGRLFQRDAPQLEYGLVQRHRMLDALLENWSGKHVLELAAGLSPRGARFSADPDRQYVELDTPPVLTIKRGLLAQTLEGQDIALRSNLHFAPGDLEHMDLPSLVPPDEPLFVIAEGLLMYLDAQAQRRLWGRIAELLEGRPGSVFAFDLVPPPEQPAGGTVGHVLGRLMGVFTGGRRLLRDDRGRAELLAEMEASGLPRSRCLSPVDAPASWEVPYLDMPSQQLLFIAEG